MIVIAGHALLTNRSYARKGLKGIPELQASDLHTTWLPGPSRAYQGLPGPTGDLPSGFRREGVLGADLGWCFAGIHLISGRCHFFS